MNKLKWMGRTVAIAVASASAVALGAAKGGTYTVPMSTPQGVTLVDVSKVMDDAIPQFLWRRIGDQEGKPLYTRDADLPGRSMCVAECAKEFPPFVADAQARASGDFTIIKRADGIKQWAYQGQPLYRYSGKDPDGEPIGARIALKEDPAWVDPGSEVYSPKGGWRRAAFVPEKSTAMPSNVELAGLAIANGFGFVDAASRMTIYAAPVAHQLSNDWRPVRASALAHPLGQFAVITRKDDGSSQWTYRGEALYTYTGDYAPNEVNGIFTGDRDVHAALAYQNYMPADIEVAHFQGRAPLLTTSRGQPLYLVSVYRLQYGGRETRDGYFITYNDAKTQGTEACQGDCTGTWKPLIAPPDAHGWGFWEITVRADGVRQWTLKGSPVYTFVGDKNPGDVEGNNRYVIVFGGKNGEIVYSRTAAADLRNPDVPQPRLGAADLAVAIKGGGSAYDQGMHAGAGFYWHTPSLFY